MTDLTDLLFAIAGLQHMRVCFSSTGDPDAEMLAHFGTHEGLLWISGLFLFKDGEMFVNLPDSCVTVVL